MVVSPACVLRNMKNIRIPFTLFSIMVVLASCNRDDSGQPETRAMASDESIADFADRHLEGPVDAMTMRQGGAAPCGISSPYLSECVIITDSGEDVFPRTITLDFGEGCTGPGGVTRSGVLDIVMTGDMDVLGSVRTTTFDEFQVGNLTLTGTRVLSNIGPNDEESQALFEQSHAMTIERNGHIITRTYEGILAWLEGFDTEDCEDNVVERNGVASHSTASAWGNSTRLIEAVVYDRSCGYPVSGTVTVERPVHNIVVDFGDGSCDNMATVSRNGNTYNLNLDTHEIDG